MRKLLFIALLWFGSLNIYSDYSINQATESININGVSIAYTTAGEEENPSVLMIMGLMASHKVWGEEIVNGLVDSGYRVILFDNRDTGESENLDRLGKPNLYWKFAMSYLGVDFSSPYTLSDMALDGIGLLDYLGVERAHVVGASMGGMIAQTIASEFPERTKSLVSIMSTTGAPHLSQMSEGNEQNFRNTGDWDKEAVHAYGFYPEAMPRQITAIMKSGDRSEQVRSIKVSTLVQHGVDDTLLPLDHGEHTAELISNSKLKIYENMGHNLPPEVLPLVIEDMVNFFNVN
ncbi:MAG: alpha/beta hydrolase [Gammaproteobacteria bacterium]|nr:alpha/beta hydrolase [Gammaproteobacteria bacterium]HJL96199.1 alpha/beta hydrolase [SAR86 cluster bacterium]